MPSNSPAPKTESATQQIMAHDQSTHHAAAVASVWGAFFKLKDNYTHIIDVDNETALDNFYPQIIKYIRETWTPQTFFTAKETPNAELLAETQRKLDVVLRYIEDSITRKDHYLNNINNESRRWNEATLYINGQQVTKFYPIRTIFLLVFFATIDSSRYVHHYSGTAEDKLEQAKADIPARLHTLLNTLYDRQRAQFCGVGVRDALIATLDKTYENIHLMANFRAPFESVLKEALYQRLKTKLECTDPESEEAQELLTAFYYWMTDSNAAEVFRLIDSDNAIKQQVSEYFRQQGHDPNIIIVTIGGASLTGCDAIMREILTQLHYDVSDERNIWTQIAYFLNEEAESGSTLSANASTFTSQSARALNKIQQWIRENFKVNTSSAWISDFYAIYQAKKIIDKNKSRFTMIEGYTEAYINTLLDDINTYYSAFNGQRVEEFASIAIAEDFMSRISEINSRDSASRAHQYIDHIENFFAKWFFDSGSKVKTRSPLYLLLTTSEFQKATSITDEIFATWAEKYALDIFQDITPYQINRVLLHAIIHLPEGQQWTPRFAKELERILTFISRSLTETSAGTHVQASSYPQKLQNQMAHLLYRYKEQHENSAQSSDTHPSPEKPFYPIVLPRHITQPNEWLYFSRFMSPELRLQSATFCLVVIKERLIKGMLQTGLENYFKLDRSSIETVSEVFNMLVAQTNLSIKIKKILNSLPLDTGVLFETKNVLKKYSHFIKVGVIVDFLPGLVPELLDHVCETWSTQLSAIISVGNNLAAILKALHSSQADAFYQSIGKYCIVNSIKTSEDVASVLSELEPKQILNFVRTPALLSHLCSLIKTPQDIVQVLEKLNPPQIISGFLACDFLCKHLFDLIKTPEDIAFVLGALEPEQIFHFMLTRHVGSGFCSLIKSPQNIVLVLNALEPPKISSFLRCHFICKHLCDLIQTPEGMASVLRDLELPQIVEIIQFSSVSKHLLGLIQTTEDIASVLRELEPKKIFRFVWIPEIETHFCSLIQTAEDIASVLETLQPEQIVEFVWVRGISSHFSSLIKCPEDIIPLLRELTFEQFSSFADLSAMSNILTILIRNEHKITDFKEQLRPRQQSIFSQIIEAHKKREEANTKKAHDYRCTFFSAMTQNNYNQIETLSKNFLAKGA